MTRSDLDERLRRILKFVVESHIQSAEPVGSQHVRAAYHLSISPATIRSAMQRLEALGLLHHPHTSAGRLPTEAGYRVYVDDLMEPEDLPAATRRAIDAMLAPGADRGDEVGASATHALARASRQLALLACRHAVPRAIERVEVVHLSGGLVLLAIGGRDGELPAASWRPEPAVDVATLARAESWLRARLPLPGPAELRALAAGVAGEAAPETAAFLADALERGARLLEAVEAPAVRIDGAEHIARQPEFQSADRLRSLVTILAERERLTRALDSVAGSAAVRITIGRENGPGALGSCAIVAAGIEVLGLRGSIGILGPVRLPYPRIVSLVTYVRGRLAERA
jgi:heat-inducible transcriptional repressor